MPGGEGALFKSSHGLALYDTPNATTSLECKRKAAYLLDVGVYTAGSVTSTVRTVSMTGCGFAASSTVLFGFAVVAGSATADEDAFSIAEASGSELDCPGCSFLLFSLASSPSTLFRSASRTSVLGPRFFGTASAHGGWYGKLPRSSH
jgi:hypothetical protein